MCDKCRFRCSQIGRVVLACNRNLGWDAEKVQEGGVSFADYVGEKGWTRNSQRPSVDEDAVCADQDL